MGGGGVGGGARGGGSVRTGESETESQLLWCSYEPRGAGRAGIKQAHSFSGCTSRESRQSKRVSALTEVEESGAREI